MVQHRGSRSVKLYEGAQIMELVAWGLKLEPLCLELDACVYHLDQLGA